MVKALVFHGIPVDEHDVKTDRKSSPWLPASTAGVVAFMVTTGGAP